MAPKKATIGTNGNEKVCPEMAQTKQLFFRKNIAFFGEMMERQREVSLRLWVTLGVPCAQQTASLSKVMSTNNFKKFELRNSPIRFRNDKYFVRKNIFQKNL